MAKQYRNAHINMCWSWVIDPVASTAFLKSYLMTAPANKVLVFGGDYRIVECVLGHARMAREGVARALRGLVEEGYLAREDALDLVDLLLRGSAHRISLWRPSLHAWQKCLGFDGEQSADYRLSLAVRGIACREPRSINCGLHSVAVIRAKVVCAPFVRCRSRDITVLG